MASKQSTLKPFFLSSGSLKPPSKTPRVELDLDQNMSEDELSNESENEIEEESENEIEEESNYESYYNEGIVCRKECCVVTGNEPYHLVNVSSSTKKHGKQNRSIQRSWFNDYKWLTYCTTRNSL